MKQTSIDKSTLGDMPFIRRFCCSHGWRNNFTRRRINSKEVRYAKQAQQDNTLGQLPIPVVKSVTRNSAQTAPLSWSTKVRTTG